MKSIIKSLIIGAMALVGTYAAQAATPFIIAGDASALGSGDSTLVCDGVGRQLVNAAGLRNPSGIGVTQPLRETIADGRAQTVVSGIAAAFAEAGRADNSYVFEIIGREGASVRDFAADAALGKALVADIKAYDTAPAAIAWMQGDADIASGMSADSYKSAMLALQNMVSAAAGRQVRVIIVQNASQSLHRTISGDKDSSRGAVATAQLELCVDYPDRFTFAAPTYMFDRGADLYSPSSRGQYVIGAYIARAFDRAADPIYVRSVDAADNTVTVKLNVPSGNLVIDDVNVALADNLGFTVARGTGDDERHLNITAVDVKADGTVTITTNEQLAAGDRIVYGSYSESVGPLCGSRGNLRDSATETVVVPGAEKTVALYNYCPLFSYTLGNVAHPSANIKGSVLCEGRGVAGVAVSDGVEVTTTDADGRYWLSSTKRYGYVFYSLPAGYEPQTESNGFQVKIYSKLTSGDAGVVENHDFVLRRADNDDHILVVGADTHLANRTRDLAQFKSRFIPRLNEFIKANPGKKIYSTILGDLTWDQYWTANNYGLPEFVETLTENKYPLMLFPVMGNHDNDPSIPAGADTDFLSAQKFRQTIAPSYYSFNLGKVHYVVLDDIIYTNKAVAGTNYPAGVAGSRDYGQYYTDEQLEWLRRDIELVKDKDCPVVVMFHIQNWSLSTDGNFKVSAALNSGSSDALAKILKDFSQVNLLSGHTHYNYHARPDKYPNIHENNVAAICATWWWTGRYTSRHICKDGSPGGFASYSAAGDRLTWKYHSLEETSDPQFRVYDMNTVKEFYKTDANIKAILAKYPTRTNYATIADNTVYVNVFNYDIDWKVEIFEGDTQLTPKRINAEDPLHTLVYDVAKWKATGTITESFTTNRTGHMFTVTATTADKPITVRVTDSFGNVYSDTVERPIKFTETIGMK